MAIRLSIYRKKNKLEFFYKTIKGLKHIIRGRSIDSCRIDVDINSERDLDELEATLKDLRLSMKSVQ